MRRAAAGLTAASRLAPRAAPLAQRCKSTARCARITLERAAPRAGGCGAPASASRNEERSAGVTAPGMGALLARHEVGS